ncbi:MAG: type II toxin-antitoxin system VapC family toxin [Ignavibacteriaceae bacterium]|nr:type II toxin-antitoxin system VapC family toxin [Ignavibacteriaceae bacterium]
MLDTNICIYLMKGDKEVSEAIGQINGNEIAISFITLSELYYGAYKSVRK